MRPLERSWKASIICTVRSDTLIVASILLIITNHVIPPGDDVAGVAPIKGLWHLLPTTYGVLGSCTPSCGLMDLAQHSQNACRQNHQALPQKPPCAGDKYAVFMVPDPEADRQEGGSGSSANAASKERVAFIVSPAKFATPQEAPAWQIVVAGVLFLLSLGTATQIGLAANVTRFLPQVLLMQHCILFEAAAVCLACSLRCIQNYVHLLAKLGQYDMATNWSCLVCLLVTCIQSCTATAWPLCTEYHRAVVATGLLPGGVYAARAGTF